MKLQAVPKWIQYHTIQSLLTVVAWCSPPWDAYPFRTLAWLKTAPGYSGQARGSRDVSSAPRISLSLDSHYTRRQELLCFRYSRRVTYGLVSSISRCVEIVVSLWTDWGVSYSAKVEVTACCGNWNKLGSAVKLNLIEASVNPGAQVENQPCSEMKSLYCP